MEIEISRILILCVFLVCVTYVGIQLGKKLVGEHTIEVVARDKRGELVPISHYVKNCRTMNNLIFWLYLVGCIAVSFDAIWQVFPQSLPWWVDTILGLLFFWATISILRNIRGHKTWKY